MVIFLWKHSTKKTNDISLHDCCATRIFKDKHNLFFEFDNGIWAIANTAFNPNNRTFRTDKAQLKLCNFNIDSIYIFKEIRLFRRIISTHRIPLSFEKLTENINSGKWELEFIYEYTKYHETLFSCCICSAHKPYSIECQMILDYDDMECFWNNLREDNPW